MESHHDGFFTEAHPKFMLKFFATKQLQIGNCIKNRSTKIEHSLRLFTQLQHSVAVLFGGNKVQVRKLGNRVAQGVIHGPQGELTTVNVRHRNQQYGRGSGHCKRLETIAENHNHIGF